MATVESFSVSCALPFQSINQQSSFFFSYFDRHNMLHRSLTWMCRSTVEYDEGFLAIDDVNFQKKLRTNQWDHLVVRCYYETGGRALLFNARYWLSTKETRHRHDWSGEIKEYFLRQRRQTAHCAENSLDHWIICLFESSLSSLPFHLRWNWIEVDHEGDIASFSFVVNGFTHTKQTVVTYENDQTNNRDDDQDAVNYYMRPDRVVYDGDGYAVDTQNQQRELMNEIRRSCAVSDWNLRIISTRDDLNTIVYPLRRDRALFVYSSSLILMLSLMEASTHLSCIIITKKAEFSLFSSIIFILTTLVISVNFYLVWTLLTSSSANSSAFLISNKQWQKSPIDLSGRASSCDNLIRIKRTSFRNSTQTISGTYNSNNVLGLRSISIFQKTHRGFTVIRLFSIFTWAFNSCNHDFECCLTSHK